MKLYFPKLGWFLHKVIFKLLTKVTYKVWKKLLYRLFLCKSSILVQKKFWSFIKVYKVKKKGIWLFADAVSVRSCDVTTSDNGSIVPLFSQFGIPLFLCSIVSFVLLFLCSIVIYIRLHCSVEYIGAVQRSVFPQSLTLNCRVFLLSLLCPAHSFPCGLSTPNIVTVLREACRKVWQWWKTSQPTGSASVIKTIIGCCRV
jgi:hypothetical protein